MRQTRPAGAGLPFSERRPAAKPGWPAAALA